MYISLYKALKIFSLSVRDIFFIEDSINNYYMYLKLTLLNSSNLTVLIFFIMNVKFISYNFLL
jgi:hypothetical protein